MPLQSDITNWIVKFAIGQSGKAVRLVVGMIIASVAKQHIIPDGDLDHIRLGLESGGMSLLALAYGYFEFWVNQKRLNAGKAVQQSINAVLPAASQIAQDGHIGNQTIAAFTAATGIPVLPAIPVAR